MQLCRHTLYAFFMSYGANASADNSGQQLPVLWLSYPVTGKEAESQVLKRYSSSLGTWSIDLVLLS